MGDRVAIIGGSTVGRDHFPWPILDCDPTTGGFHLFYPVALELDRAMKWLLRTKKWKLTGECGATVNYVTGGDEIDFPLQSVIGDGLILEVSATATPNIPLTRESEVVLIPALQYGEAGTGTAITGTATGGDSPTLTCGVGLNVDVTAGVYGGMPFKDDIFYPQFQLSITLRTEVETDFGTQFAEVTFVTSFDGGLAGTSGLPPMLIDGVEVPVGKAFDQGEEGIGIDSSTAYITALSLDPVEFWPYATRDGSPVYDTSTGEQIADPFS